jgi:PAS domain S-box-containing protein
VQQHETMTKAELIAELNEVQRSEERLRSLIEQTSDPLFCYEFDPPIRTSLPAEAQIGLMYDCTLVECNDAYAALQGAEQASDVVGKKLTQLFSATPSSLDELFKAVVEGGYQVIDREGTEIRDDGTRRYFLNNGHGVVREGLLVRVWGTCRDSTERRRAERLLRSRYELAMAMEQVQGLEDSLHLLAETAITACNMDCGGIYLVDPASQDLDLACDIGMPAGFVRNAAHCAAHSASGRLLRSGKAVYAGHDDMGVPMDRERREEGLRAFAIVPVVHEDHVIACLNVGSFSLDQVPDFARTFLEAITGQAGSAIAKAGQLSTLRRGEANLRALLNSLQDLIFVLDMEGAIIELNETVVRRLGYARDELVGESIFELHPANRRGEIATIIADIAAGKTDWHPVPLVTNDGTLVAVETRVVRGLWDGEEAFFAVSSALARHHDSQ